MAEQLDEYEFSRKGGGGSKYDEYLDGKIYRILADGRSPLSLRTSLYERATKSGKKIHTRLETDPPAVVVQAYDPGKS